MNSFSTILKAMFVNKLRFGESATKRKKIALFVMFALVYALVMFVLLSAMIKIGDLLREVKQFAMMMYFFIMITAAVLVMVFGIIHLLNTLYLSKDTDFYSSLPVKSMTVFAAKLTFVYLSEIAIFAAIMLPLSIAFGVIINAWIPFYFISILTIVIVPSLPLALAAIIAIPVMFLAGKLKHRNIVSLIFYIVLFGGFFCAYLYFMMSNSSIDEDQVLTEEQLDAAWKTMQTVFYIFYPYTALAFGALGIPSHGLSVGADAVVNIAIFLVISFVLIAILLFAGKFMYSQSVKANNQTFDNKAKKGKYKIGGGIKALVKREYLSSLRTTQVAFQCYAVFVLPIISAVVMNIIMMRSFGATDGLENMPSAAGVYELITRLPLMVTLCCIIILLSAISNAAATSFSREGSAITTLKTLPIGIHKIVAAKSIAWLAISIPVVIVSTVIANVFNFSVSLFLLSLFGLIALTIVMHFFGVLWDLSAPKLNWTDPLQAVKHNAHVMIGQFICMAFGFIELIVFMVLFSSGVEFGTVSAAFWIILYASVAILAVVDIILYKRAEFNYKKIEI